MSSYYGLCGIFANSGAIICSQNYNTFEPSLNWHEIRIKVGLNQVQIFLQKKQNRSRSSRLNFNHLAWVGRIETLLLTPDSTLIYRYT